MVVIPSAFPAGGLCEKYQKTKWSFGLGKNCHMHSTVIDSKNFLLTSPRDETVEAFYATDNKRLEYLPVNIYKKLPNIIGLYAQYCSIKEMSKENLKGLTKLRKLYLAYNQIGRIEGDTFDHIIAVEEIYLWEYCLGSVQQLRIYLQGVGGGDDDQGFGARCIAPGDSGRWMYPVSTWFLRHMSVHTGKMIPSLFIKIFVIFIW